MNTTVLTENSADKGIMGALSSSISRDTAQMSRKLNLISVIGTTGVGKSKVYIT